MDFWDAGDGEQGEVYGGSLGVNRTHYVLSFHKGKQAYRMSPYKLLHLLWQIEQ